MRLLILTFCCLAITTLRGQVMGNYQNQRPTTVQNYQPQFRAVAREATFAANPREMNFTLNALSNQRASAYLAFFSVFQAGATVGEVNQAMNERIAAMTAGLVALGIPREDIYVDMVNFLPTYAYREENKIFSKKTLTEKPTGFQLQKNLHVRYRDAALLDKIMTAATEAEIYDIIKVDEIVESPQGVYQELRERTFAYLDTVKALYSRQGIDLDSARMRVTESAWVVYPGDRYKSYSAHASQQLTKEDKASANVSRIDKPTLRFYDAIPVNDYDLVLNPEVLVPTAQFTYSLKVKFLLPEKQETVELAVQTVTEHTYFYLTPNGEVVPLPLGTAQREAR